MSSNPSARPSKRPADQPTPDQPTPDPVIAISALSVVVAVMLFVVWLLDWGPFALVYVSMGLAVLAIGLLWSSRGVGTRTEPSDQDEARAGPAPDRVEGPATPTRSAETSALPEVPIPAPAVPEPPAESTVGVPAREAPVDGTRDVPARAGSGADVPAVVDPPDPNGASEVAGGFPIADYDQLWVSQIVPLIAQLDGEELATVEAGERAGRNRSTILSAIAAGAEDAPTAPDAMDADQHLDVDDGHAKESADLDEDPAAGDHPDREAAEPSATAQTLEPRVRTFLGRRRSPMTVRQR